MATSRKQKTPVPIEGLRAFGDTAKGLARNPLGIIALFIVLVYGFAALVTGFASSLTAGERLPLIWFLTLFPVLVLAVFAWLVSQHGRKLYGPSDYKDEANYMRMQLEHLEAAVMIEATPPQRIPSASAASFSATLHNDSRLAIAQMRLDVEKEMFLLSRYSPRCSGVPGLPVADYLRELEKEKAIDSGLAGNLRDFIGLANRIVHGTEVPELEVERSASVGSALVAKLHRTRLLAELQREFDGHGLWHFHRKRGKGNQKYLYWSAVAATLPEFEYDYDVYLEGTQRYNEKLTSDGHETDRFYVLSLEEFVAVLEFRESELRRLIPLWSCAGGWNSDRALEWHWPSEWGDVGWNGGILQNKVSLWGAEEDLMCTRTALAFYRTRLSARSHADPP